MANDRLPGAYMVPYADGSQVRGEPAAHAPSVVADMYVAEEIDEGRESYEEANHREICRRTLISQMCLSVRMSALERKPRLRSSYSACAQ